MPFLSLTTSPIFTPVSIFRPSSFGENTLRQLGHFFVSGTEECRHGFEDGDFGTETTPDTAHFQADHAGTDHTEAFRHFFQIQRADVVEHVDVIDSDTWQITRLEPEAMITCWASMDFRIVTVTSICHFSFSRLRILPWPLMLATLFFLNSNWMPPVNWSTIFFARDHLADVDFGVI